MTPDLLPAGGAQVRFGGTGGQGVILMGVILALAATRDHRHVVQTQSYGPEARGGYVRSDVIVSSAPIDFPQPQSIDLLVALSQEACDKFAGELAPAAVLVYDSGLVTPAPNLACRCFGAPLTSLATETTGRAQTTNILTLGAVGGLTAVVSVDSLEKAVMGMVPPGTEEMNVKALRTGLELPLESWVRTGAGAAKL